MLKGRTEVGIHMKIQNRNRAMLLAVFGGYVIYLAYEIMRDELAGKSSMAMWVCILCTVFLAAAGTAVLILAWKVYKTKDPEEKEEPEDPKNLK